MENRWCIAATYEGDPLTFKGTPCWLIRPPSVLRRCLIGVESRKGRWSERWVHEDTLTGLRVDKLPEPDSAEHARAMPFDRYPTQGEAEEALRLLLEQWSPR